MAGDTTTRVFTALCLLAGLWIAVYWWWDPSPDRITFAQVHTEPNPRPSTQPKAQSRPESTPQPRPQQRPRSARPPEQTPAVIPPEFDQYTVQPGDSWESIAARFLGSQSHADTLRRANALRDGASPRPGITVRIPRDPENIQGKPAQREPDRAPEPPREPSPEPPAGPPDGSAPGPVQEYVVQPGDVLSRISSRFYGTSRHAEHIYLYNRQRLGLRNMDSIREGQVLLIPPKPD